MEKPIKCSCGKLIAKERDGKIYLWCKNCRREVELKIEKESHYEPENNLDGAVEHTSSRLPQ